MKSARERARRDGKLYSVEASVERAALYRDLPPSRSFTVTPLVAAPPSIGEDEADLVRRLDDARAGKGEYADDVEILRALCGEAMVAVRHLASLSCVADPAGAPSYTELSDALREAASYLPHYAALCLDNGLRASHTELAALHARCAALLSRRLPQQEVR